ncbi:MAG: NAD(P)/FAD-dependent oxidoreductase [Firmicutes bacterium]|nr:NAD(P)/FAD-dependent oxidoreductase [Bacillota bacterium]
MLKVAVIGGGPAGLMTAGTAAKTAKEQGISAKVTLLDGNNKLGKKLYITGKGRCNITNTSDDTYDTQDFLNNVVNNKRFLFSSISKFGASDVISFFENLGVKLKIERGGRVFPESDKASDITKALEKYCQKYGVEILLEHKVNNIADVTSYDKVVIATGGVSYPSTGSTGSGYEFAKEIGHTIIKPRPALAPIILKGKTPKRLEGLTLKNVGLKIIRGNQELFSDFGEMLFTADGVSGPLALSASSYITRDYFGSQLQIDLKPRLDFATLDKRILADFAKFINKQLKNSLDELLPKRLIDVVIEIADISPEKTCNSVTAIERERLVSAIKNMSFEIGGIDTLDKAIITSGGVDVSQIDPKTMESKIRKGIYFAGEVIDVDALTGGYNITIALSTGYSAGVGVING